jgi:hypothetical protein
VRVSFAAQPAIVELWLWEHTDEFGKRRMFACRLTEEDAKSSLRDPVKVEGSLERRTPPALGAHFRP